MILNKEYYYLSPSGKKELISGKVSPSNLKRANIPDKLIRDYSLAHDRVQTISGLKNSPGYATDNGKIRFESDTAEAKKKLKAAHKSIEDFLETQQMLNFGIIDFQKILKLLNSDVSAYQIEKKTGISRMAIGNLKNGTSEVSKMIVKNAYMLSEYAKSLGM
ncbi:hypothetical protein [uncultured Enterococcus sp.]|uniref:hypothetical protein n=1 Tax=uncultured Enterococcus sp. TaxID=167972 RepID=UPI002805C5F2|nr:hypothetical protein [uncultured Enterococcus sp.]